MKKKKKYSNFKHSKDRTSASFHVEDDDFYNQLSVIYYDELQNVADIE